METTTGDSRDSLGGGAVADRTSSPQTLLLIVAWLWVGIPLAWGVYNTVQKALPLFRG
jgi:hypothetical protein